MVGSRRDANGTDPPTPMVPANMVWRMRRLRQSVLLGVVVLIVLLAMRRRRRAGRALDDAGAQWPALVLRSVPAPAEGDAAGSATSTDAVDPSWVSPIAGGCPSGYPIKVARSGIFHVPDGLSYERTSPVRCYARTDDAEADGYRRAKL